ncbi:MAG: A/G-specific adenine glycosylase [Salibacteraceae bacterium]
MEFNKILLQWYDKNKRDLPWRTTDNPYVIWIAEVVFQQTRIEQGTPYFLSFINKFPTVFDLAKAKEEDVLNKWQGLGYYSRARNLQFSAKYIVDELNGEMPSTYKSLLGLKGVGPYIAAEVASVCFNEVVAAVDGNVQRVLSRCFGVKEAVNSTKGSKIVNELANSLISKQRPGDFNQALMDMGSSICTPKKPKCEECIFVETCWANRNGFQLKLPKKDKKVKVRDRYFNYYLINGSSMLLKKRGGGDVWQGLYEPPLMETNQPFEIKKECGYLLFSSKRVLSHQRIYIKFWVVNELPEHFNDQDFHHVTRSEVNNYPVPKSIEQLFSSIEFGSLFNGG